MNNTSDIGEVIIYTAPDGTVQTEVRLEGETLWLSQRKMAELFDKDNDTISLHLKNIYTEGGLDELATTENYSVVQKEGARSVTRKVRHYNLDAILSVGYRVNSKRGTLFRIWANRILKEYLVKGYSINQKLLQEKQTQIDALKQTITVVERGLVQQIETVEEACVAMSILRDFAQGLTILDDYDHENHSYR